MGKIVKMSQVDAFTTRPFGGNPAAVVLDAAGLSEEQMKAIAGEMNLPETAYLFPAEVPGADYRLRWFTPTVEMNFCGHATVATVHTMAEAGLLRDGRVVFQIRAGLLPVVVEDGTIWLEPAVPQLTPVTEDLGELLTLLGLSRNDLAEWARPALGGERDLLLPCRSLDVLRRTQPDFTKLKALGEARDWRGFCLTTIETFEPASSLHSRFFSPQTGVAEDPVTGSVHASLAVYVTGAGKAPDRFIAEQGDFLGRPGRLRIQVERAQQHAAPRRVRVGGSAVTVLRGELLLP